MESVPSLIRSAVARWQSWSPIQRSILGATAGLILLGALAIGFQNESIRYVPLSLGKQFSAEDLVSIEQNLRDKDLTSFRREGSQLLVPENEQTAYDAALMQERQLPNDWASEWEQRFKETNPFTSSSKLRMLEEIARAKELKRIIQGLDGIEEANVVWAESESQSWPSRRQKVTASVNIRPERGYTLSEQTIRAIQFSVANMVPNLEPEDVVILDCSIGRIYQLEPEQARFESDLQRWVDREVARWYERLHSALVHHWPDAEILVRLRQEELRQVAWQMLRSKPDVAGHERTVYDLELELQQRFPEFIQLTVTLPHTAGEALSATDTTGVLPEDEVLAALIGWLPASFDAHQLRVNLESPPADEAEPEVTGRGQTKTHWQSTAVVSAAGLLLLLVGLRYQSTSQISSRGADPAIESAVTGDHLSAAGDTPAGHTDVPPVTPLGDPELVADVLKQWLGSSDKKDDVRSSLQIPRETD